MIYLTEGNVPLNAAYADEIVQIDRNTYQLTFKFPTNNILWQRLREETFLTAEIYTVKKILLFLKLRDSMDIFRFMPIKS